MVRKKVSDEMVDEFIRLYFDEKWSLRNIAKYFGLSPKTVWYHIKKKNKILRTYYEGKVIRNGLKLNLEPSKSLAYVLGVIEGDGCVTKNDRHYYIRLNVIDKDFADEFECHLRNIGFTKIQRYIRKSKSVNRKDLHVVNVYSKYFYEWYWNLNKYESYLKMFNSNHEYIAMFLKGIFDSEGCVYLDCRKNRKPQSTTITISNTDIKLINLCCNFLDILCIEYNIKSRKRNNNLKDMYDISIKPYNFNDFKDKIGTSIKRKYDKMCIACNMNRKNRLTNDEKNKIIKLYNGGCNINQISEKLDRNRSTVRSYLQKENMLSTSNK